MFDFTVAKFLVLIEILIAQGKTLLLVVLFIIHRNRLTFFLTKMAVKFFVLESRSEMDTQMHKHRARESV